MNFEKHSNLEGYHATFSPSNCRTWIGKEDEAVLDMHVRSYAQQLGTAFHDIARKHIKRRTKVTKSNRNEIVLSLIEDYGIPYYVIEMNPNFDNMYNTFMLYTNDCIGFRMVPEQILYHSNLCFGTTDAINSLDQILKTKVLRIHDLKTGVMPAHMEQLYVYAALFCLEYKMKPEDLQIELRLYQNGEMLNYIPEAEEIVEVMEQIKRVDSEVQKLIMEE